jgi:hypothetical protein
MVDGSVGGVEGQEGGPVRILSALGWTIRVPLGCPWVQKLVEFAEDLMGRGLFSGFLRVGQYRVVS